LQEGALLGQLPLQRTQEDRHLHDLLRGARCQGPVDEGAGALNGLPGELDVAVAGGVATLTLNRPGKRNALSIELRRALAGALASAAADTEVRCTVITGAGSAFCAGMDTAQFGGDAANRAALLESTDAMSSALLDHAKPLVAAVNGPAVGGGFVLALLCDLRLASSSARFGFPELERGIPASYGAARAALPRAVAADLCLTGRVVGAEEALGLGIVSAVGDLDALVADRADRIAALPARGVDTVKQWMREDRGDPRALLDLERRAFEAALSRPG
jgi:enoyl-CoA hydratase/carnithine racemase